MEDSDLETVCIQDSAKASQPRWRIVKQSASKTASQPCATGTEPGHLATRSHPASGHQAPPPTGESPSTRRHETAALQHGSRREEKPRRRRRPRGLSPAASSGGGAVGVEDRSGGGARVGRAPESPWAGRRGALPAYRAKEKIQAKLHENDQ
nr:uncharacterized protein LOC109747828 [Aegilops tauschii subsp. strangulata]